VVLTADYLNCSLATKLRKIYDNNIWIPEVISAKMVSNWDKAGIVFLFIFSAADLFSISIAQCAAAGLVVCWVCKWIQTKHRPGIPSIWWTFVAFIVASLTSAVLSLDPIESLKDSNDLAHIAIFFAAYDILWRNRTLSGKVLRLIAVVGTVISIVGFAQILQRGIDIYNRISGFNDMYMTYAGLLMIVIISALAIILFSFKKWSDSWLPFAVLIMGVALLLSLTRSAWVGLFIGCSILIALRKPFAIIIIPVVVAIGLAASPDKIRDRAFSMFDKNQKSNKERIYLWGAGLKIIKDYPIFGVGQNSFPIVYPKYRHPDVKEPTISHLHNNFLEIAAERGLVGLFCWSLVWASALWVMLRSWTIAKINDRERIMALGASIASTISFLVAGFFEYNFGDSEVQMLLYLLIAIGLASARDDKIDQT